MNAAAPASRSPRDASPSESEPRRKAKQVTECGCGLTSNDCRQRTWKRSGCTREHFRPAASALASSRLGACLIFTPADHAQEHGQSKNRPATLIGINKSI